MSAHVLKPSASSNNAYVQSWTAPSTNQTMGRQAEYQPKLNWLSFTKVVCPIILRFCTLAVLLAAITLGCSAHPFDVDNVSFATLSLEPDVLLMLVAVVNKLLDYLMDETLGHLASSHLTLWMVGTEASWMPTLPAIWYNKGYKSSFFKASTTPAQPQGITKDDFCLKEEMAKPWMSIFAFWRRSRSPPIKFRWSSFLRFLLTLAVSICFALSGAGMNTIGIPKARWYPDDWLYDQHIVFLPMAEVVGVGWINNWEAASSFLGGGVPWRATAASLSSAQLFTALASNLGTMYRDDRAGWQLDEPGGWPIERTIPQATRGPYNAILTSRESGPLHSLSIPTAELSWLWNAARRWGPSYAKNGQGMMGTANLTSFQLLTRCVEDETAAPVLARVESIGNLLMMDIPYTGSRGDMRASCETTLQRVLAPIEFGGEQSTYYYYGNFTLNYLANDSIKVLPTTEADSAITSDIATQVSSMLPSLNGLSPDDSYATFISLLADRVSNIVGNDTKGNPKLAVPSSLQPIVAYTLQHTLSNSNWTITAADQSNQIRHLLRFYIYGSGPRMQWQWVALVVLLVLTFVCIYDLYLMLRHALTPGPWLALGGMMEVSNISEKLESDDVARDLGLKYAVCGDSDGRLQISNKHPLGRLLQRQKVYSISDD